MNDRVIFCLVVCSTFGGIIYKEYIDYICRDQYIPKPAPLPVIDTSNLVYYDDISTPDPSPIMLLLTLLFIGCLSCVGDDVPIFAVLFDC